MNEPSVSVNVKVNSHGLAHLCALFYTCRVAVQPQYACHFWLALAFLIWWPCSSSSGCEVSDKMQACCVSNLFIMLASDALLSVLPLPYPPFALHKRNAHYNKLSGTLKFCLVRIAANPLCFWRATRLNRSSLMGSGQILLAPLLSNPALPA